MDRSSNVGIADSLPRQLTLIQISRSSFSLPPDVILKLPDGGSIEAHKSILAAVSPVFEKMFYGDFKEGKSMMVNLPKESSMIMSLLIDFVYQGSCELKNIDDIFPTLEAFDRYQINKIPFYHMCSKVILAQIESSNYLNLLQRFAKVMTEEGIKEAANRVMVYTNNDFIANFDATKDLPEQVILQLLQMDITNHEVDVFDFLVKWHDYQAKDLGTPLQLTQKLFQNVKYPLIIPEVLSSRVIPRDDLVNKQLLIDTYCHIYNSCKPLGEYDDKDGHQEPCLRKPSCSLKLEWVLTGYQYNNYTITHDKLNVWNVTFNSNSVSVNENILKSFPLENGIYTFSVLNIAAKYTQYSQYKRQTETVSYGSAVVSVAVINQSDKSLYFHPLVSDSLITVNVYGKYLFLKLVEGDKAKSTTSILDDDQFSICIYNLMSNNQSPGYDCSFSIHNHNIII